MQLTDQQVHAVVNAIINDCEQYRHVDELRGYVHTLLSYNQYQNTRMQTLVETAVDYILARMYNREDFNAILGNVANTSVAIQAAVSAANDHAFMQFCQPQTRTIIQSMLTLAQQIEQQVLQFKNATQHTSSAYPSAGSPYPASAGYPTAAQPQRMGQLRQSESLSPVASQFVTPMSKPNVANALASAVPPTSTAAVPVYTHSAKTTGYVPETRKAIPEQTTAADPVPVVGIRYAIDPNLFTATVVDGVQTVTKRSSPVNIEKHSFHRAYVPPSQTVREHKPDFFGVLSSASTVTVSDDSQPETLAELTADLENKILLHDRAIVALSREQGDLLFRAAQLEKGITVSPDQCYIYDLRQVTVLDLLPTVEAVDELVTQGLNRLLTPPEDFSALQRAMEDLCKANANNVVRNVVRRLDKRLTRELNVFLKFILQLDCSVTSFLTDWNELVDVINTLDIAEDFHAKLSFSDSLSGEDTYGDVILQRCLITFAGDPDKSEIGAVINKMVNTTRKSVTARSIYDIDDINVVHVPAAASELQIDLAKTGYHVVSSEYAPAFHQLLEASARHIETLGMSGRILIVSEDDVAFEVWASSYMDTNDRQAFVVEVVSLPL